jgi:hypothetical protein
MGAAERAAAAPARNPLVDKVLDPSTPEALRHSAARGALPIPVGDLIYVQVRLLSDKAGSVATAALESLARLTPEAAAPVVRDPSCAPEVLDYFARFGKLPADLLAAIIAHPAITDATLEKLAAEGDADTLNLIITNEVRVIASPALLAALHANQQLRTENRRRLGELERDFIGKAPIRLAEAGPEPAVAAATGAAQAGGEPSLPASAGGAEEPPPEGGEEPPPYDPAAEQQAEEALRRSDAYQRIMRLNVAERNLLAMKGNSEERAILVRDTARVVSMAVLKNPRLSDSEITNFCGMRNIHEDILRAIASNREWTKAYAVVLNLVRNPKTPPGLTVQFLARLGTRDLRICSGDRNVPELVRRNARNLFLVRTQPAKKTFKKAH